MNHGGCNGGVTDSNGNTWAAVSQNANSSGAATEIWETTVASGGALTVTANWGSCSWPVQLASVSEWSGITITGTITDGAGGGVGRISATGSSSPVTAGAINPTHSSGDLIISIAYASSGTSVSPTVAGISGGLTPLAGQTGQAYAVYGIETSEPVQVSWNPTTSGFWSSNIVSFYP